MTLDGWRNRDQLVGERVRDRGGTGRVSVARGDCQQRVVLRDIGDDAASEFIG